MAKKKIPSWLVGCGIGCAVPVALCLGFFGGGIYYINRLAGGVDQAIETRGVYWSSDIGHPDLGPECPPPRTLQKRVERPTWGANPFPAQISLIPNS